MFGEYALDVYKLQVLRSLFCLLSFNVLQHQLRQYQLKRKEIRLMFDMNYIVFLSINQTNKIHERIHSISSLIVDSIHLPVQ